MTERVGEAENAACRASDKAPVARRHLRTNGVRLISSREHRPQQFQKGTQHIYTHAKELKKKRNSPLSIVLFYVN